MTVPLRAAIVRSRTAQSPFAPPIGAGRFSSPMTVQLMGGSEKLDGHVESISGGIEDRERGASANLLPNVNPTFSWVRLAQRIPVRELQ